MIEPDLLGISVIAFAVVFLLLSLLAVVMRALTAIFPPPAETDAALVAGIAAAAGEAYPGTRVTKIEEVR
jgi:Na+-transporting methylmalonyl-CoA/oxaloacetate decarboxylase gamma subunit